MRSVTLLLVVLKVLYKVSRFLSVSHIFNRSDQYNSTKSILQYFENYISSNFKMPSFTQLAMVAATFGALVAAMPLESRQAKTFSFNQTPGKQVVRNGPSALKAVYDKYKKPAPKDVAAAANNDGEGVNNPTASDTQYLTPVNIGGQTLNLDFDTGSSDL